MSAVHDQGLQGIWQNTPGKGCGCPSRVPLCARWRVFGRRPESAPGQLPAGRHARLLQGQTHSCTSITQSCEHRWSLTSGLLGWDLASLPCMLYAVHKCQQAWQGRPGQAKFGQLTRIRQSQQQFCGRLRQEVLPGLSTGVCCSLSVLRALILHKSCPLQLLCVLVLHQPAGITHLAHTESHARAMMHLVSHWQPASVLETPCRHQLNETHMGALNLHASPIFCHSSHDLAVRGRTCRP